MRTLRWYAVLTAVSFLASGCGSYLRYTNDERLSESPLCLPYVYGGVAYDLETISDARKPGLYDFFNGPFILLGAIDIPFSFVADTVALPVTIPFAIFNERSCENQNLSSSG